MRTGFIAILLLLGQLSFSQDNSDMSAIWARTGLSGTARTVGSGGAFGSVGADMGCTDINPAGLGVYRSTDFSLTPLLQVGNNQAVYDGSNTFSHKISFAIAQGGFVFTKVYKNASENNGNEMGFGDRPLKSISVALNFQQSSLFDHRQYYNATNTTSSLTEQYANLANSIYNTPSSSYPINFTNDPPEIAMANAFNLVQLNSSTGNYYSVLKAPVTQAGQLETSGGINRIDFGLAANLQDKLYLGINLAVPIINYNIYNDFVETPSGANPSPVQQYELTTNTTETGFGFNGILGLIYRPFPFMRIGAAYHLPTWYAMTENYNINFTEDSGSTQAGLSGGPIAADPFKYGLRTPMRGTFSASFYYKQYGFISVDYDIQNLGASRVHVPDDTAGEAASINSEIKSTYGFNHTIHAGLEAAIKIVRLRAGYYLSTSPYKSGQEVTPGYRDVRNAFTLGAGIRLTHFYVDLAYIYGWSKDASVQISNYMFPVNSFYNSSTVMLTVGWRFEAGDKKKSNNQQRSQPRYTPPPVDNDPRY